MTRPKTEPTTIPAILPLLSQGSASTSGCEVGVGVVVTVVVDVLANVGLEVLWVVLDVEGAGTVVLVFAGGCSLLVSVPTMVDGFGGGAVATDEMSGLGGVAVSVGVGSEVMKAIDVMNWIDVTRGGGSVSS